MVRSVAEPRAYAGGYQGRKECGGQIPTPSCGNGVHADVPVPRKKVRVIALAKSMSVYLHTTPPTTKGQ